MYGRYGMERNSGRRWNVRGVGFGSNGFKCNGRLGLGLGYGCRGGSTTRKELLEEQKHLLEGRLETINNQLEFYEGE